MNVHLTLHPAGSMGRYTVTIDTQDRPIIPATRQPFFNAARELLHSGISHGTELTASHVGSNIIAMRSTVGEAAKWTIEETSKHGMRKVPWRPFAGRS